MKKDKEEYHKMLVELETTIDPYRDKYNKSKLIVETKIIKDKIYIPIEKLKNYEGIIDDITVVHTWGENIKIEDYEFAGYTLKDGILYCSEDYELEDHVIYNNGYYFYDYENDIKIPMTLLGFYNLQINGEWIEETKLENLWHD